MTSPATRSSSIVSGKPAIAPTPLFSWLNKRGAGVLLHPTSLPSPHGVGVFDEQAVAFLDFLAECGFEFWQTCPLGPTGYGDSPYQCFSSFAGNPYLVDLVPLVRAGLLTDIAIAPLRDLSADGVDFGALYQRKLPMLFAAHAAWCRDGKRALPYGDFAAFQRDNAHWLNGYALFSALKDHFSGRPWWEWPAAVRSQAAAEKSPVRVEVATRVEAYAFIQYLFFGQWTQLRSHAASRGIQIIGDTPIFTALDSADVWSSPHLFQLDPKTSRPIAVAGVPPDYFSADGQLWGNPLYDWPAHAREGYAWWLARLRANFALCDIVRIDHFRGFEAYWSVPADAPTARTGRWIDGPGLDFFRAVQAAMPDAKLIAEDLGLLTARTIALREDTGLPGMAVLQFAFGGESDNLYLPHNQRANTVVYPGTHDNDTSLGWYATADEKTRDHVRRYLRISGQEIGWDLLRSAYASVSNLAVVPLQDLLSLGAEGRFNTPGQSQGNWTWRYRPEHLQSLRQCSGPYLRELAALYGRDPGATPKPATA
ncbi:4-alpha-glucanotransferase [Horticoccus sp. 23ND18S-11]|uniref:4-alpha-glucanotransferase n=1 Tax=Horticoccus sp. 23ND18S-11 TaxID=3391832 RepID=UPI0039C9CA9C